MTNRSSLKKYVKGTYGQWLLIHLPSGRWTRVWHMALGVPDMCESILTEIDGPINVVTIYATRGEALRAIVLSIERQIHNERSDYHKVLIEVDLKKARIALSRNKNAAPA